MTAAVLPWYASLGGTRAPSDQMALVDRLRRLPPAARRAFYEAVGRIAGKLADVRNDWMFWARPDQLVTNEEIEQHAVVCFAGPRGGGKTRAATQLWLRLVDEGRCRRPRIIAATEYDVEETVVFGPSGIMACLPQEKRPVWLKGEGPAGKLRFPNGVVALCFSAKVPKQLVGNQGDCDLYDDVAKWEPNIKATWDQARTSCRLRRRTGILATTDDDLADLTNVLAIAGALIKQPRDVFANRNNLAASLYAELAAEVDKDFYDAAVYGTRIANVSPFQGLEFNAAPIRVAAAAQEEFAEVVVAVDPSDGKGGAHDDFGVGVAGRREVDRHVVGIEDRTTQYTEDEGADAALDLCVAWGANTIIVETNRGPRVASAIKAAFYKRIAERNPDVPAEMPKIVGVTATDGKKLRAGPLRKLYLTGMLHHTPQLGALERQQKAWRPDGPKRPRQDDRIDWWVHAVHHLADLGGDNPDPGLQLDGLAAAMRAAQGAAPPAVPAPVIGEPGTSEYDPRQAVPWAATLPGAGAGRTIL